MPRFAGRRRASSLGALCVALAVLFATIARAQQQSDPVFKVATEVVLSAVLVFDSQGRPVDGLERDRFELVVDGTPRPILFFERVQVGSRREEAQLAAARGVAVPESSADRGRTVLFFADDLHMRNDSLVRARGLITGYLDRDMGPSDQVAIASASGQLGFLEQATSNQIMLRAAVARLGNRRRDVSDVDVPRMTPHQAQVIERGTDRELFEFFVKETLRQNPLMTREAAEAYVTGRARHMVAQSAATTREMLIALERFLSARAELPGRKVVFLLSDGFDMDPRDSDIQNRMQQAAVTAARAGAAIYTIDARGLATQPSYEASRAAVIDETRSVDRANADELAASQDPLYKIAVDSGGRMIANTNALAAAIPRVLEETSLYYVLAWAPDEAQQSGRIRRIDVNVTGGPELRVRVPRASYDAVPPQPAEPTAGTRTRTQPSSAAPAAASTIDDALLAALRAPYPVMTLPASLELEFFDLPDVGSVMTVSARLDPAALDFEGAGGQAIVDLAGAIFNDRGVGVSSVKERATLTADSSTYRRQFKVKPGLYQVRVAARDSRTGKVGSAMEWIEIPGARDGPFAISPLVVNRNADATLQFFAYLYNAKHARKSPPDVLLRTEIFRLGRRVVASPTVQLKTAGVADLSRIPYFAAVNLEGMSGGRYVLQMTATDRATGTTVSQQVAFDVEP
jgi:VWFA-related protein